MRHPNPASTTSTRNTQHGAGSTAPEWIRLPRPGEVEPRCGLTRGILSRLANEGKIKSVSLRDAGKKRGCRLIHLESLLSHLASLAEGGAQ